MNKFDEMIKSKARLETVDVPDGFCERINSLTQNIMRENIKKRTKAPYKVLAASVIIFVITGTIAFASPILANMAEGAISYFNAPKEFKYISKQAEYEKYNAEVGISCESNGITLTLDNIAVDDNYINIFYTINSKSPIQLQGEDGDPLKWRLQWTAPVFWYKADGHYIEPAAQVDQDAYLVDQYTMKGMHRFALLDQLKDNFDLEIYTNSILDAEGQWHIAVNVDKTNVAVETNTVMPNIKATVTTRWDNNISAHKITVKKVSLSPFGNQIVLSERGENIFDQFVLRDDQGNYLPIIPAAIQSSSIFKIDNSFEFITKSHPTKSITLIPIMSDGHSELKFFTLKNKLPAELPVNNFGSYILEDLQIDSKKMVAVLYQNGPVPIITPDLIPSDSSGKLLRYAKYSDQEYDRKTGLITLTYYWTENITDEDLEKIAGLSYFANYDFQLNEEEAITIELN
jgi:hypothetical protein